MAHLGILKKLYPVLVLGALLASAGISKFNESTQQKGGNTLWQWIPLSQAKFNTNMYHDLGLSDPSLKNGSDDGSTLTVPSQPEQLN
jgi:hypothetical protein